MNTSAYSNVSKSSLTDGDSEDEVFFGPVISEKEEKCKQRHAYRRTEVFRATDLAALERCSTEGPSVLLANNSAVASTNDEKSLKMDFGKETVAAGGSTPSSIIRKSRSKNKRLSSMHRVETLWPVLYAESNVNVEEPSGIAQTQCGQASTATDIDSSSLPLATMPMSGEVDNDASKENRNPLSTRAKHVLNAVKKQVAWNIGKDGAIKGPSQIRSRGRSSVNVKPLEAIVAENEDKNSEENVALLTLLNTVRNADSRCEKTEVAATDGAAEANDFENLNPESVEFLATTTLRWTDMLVHPSPVIRSTPRRAQVSQSLLKPILKKNHFESFRSPSPRRKLASAVNTAGSRKVKGEDILNRAITNTVQRLTPMKL